MHDIAALNDIFRRKLPEQINDDLVKPSGLRRRTRDPTVVSSNPTLGHQC